MSRRAAVRVLGGSSLGLSAAALQGTAMDRNPAPHPFPSWSSAPGTMLKRTIPASGELLPVVGVGSWLQFDVGATQAERQPLAGVLRTLLDRGGRVIDSSPMYGRAEEVIGELAGGMPDGDQLFCATKVWTSGQQNGITQMQDSLRKLKRTRIDLMQVHNLLDWRTHLRTLRTWKDQGLVRYTGITHYAVSAHEALEEIIRSKAVDFAQFNYSIRVRDAEKRLLKAAADHGVAVIINEPYESGRLFGLVRGKPLPPWTADYDIGSWGQFFLKFILSHPSVTCVIPGTSNPGHMLDNTGAGYGELPDSKAREKMAAYIASL